MVKRPHEPTLSPAYVPAKRQEPMFERFLHLQLAGSMLFSWLAIRSGYADMPKGVTWFQIRAGSALAIQAKPRGCSELGGQWRASLSPKQGSPLASLASSQSAVDAVSEERAAACPLHRNVQQPPDLQPLLGIFFRSIIYSYRCLNDSVRLPLALAECVNVRHRLAGARNCSSVSLHTRAGTCSMM